MSGLTEKRMQDIAEQAREAVRERYPDALDGDILVTFSDGDCFVDAKPDAVSSFEKFVYTRGED